MYAHTRAFLFVTRCLYGLGVHGRHSMSEADARLSASPNLMFKSPEETLCQVLRQQTTLVCIPRSWFRTHSLHPWM